MSKGNFHAVFDESIYSNFKDIVGKGNVTRAIEDYMKNIIAQKSCDLDGINIQILSSEIENLTKNLSKTQSELTKKLEIKNKILENQRKKEIAKLEEEKKKIEEQQTCICCHQVINENSKKHNFAKGTVCNSCFLTYGIIKLKEWE